MRVSRYTNFGIFSLIPMTTDTLIAVRDPFGIRPIVLGKLDESFVLSSESCGLDIIGKELAETLSLVKLL